MKNEKLQQIIEESQKGIDSFQSVKALAEGLMEPEGVSGFDGARDADGLVTLSWKGTPENSLDVQFQVNGKGKWHSVQWMLRNNYDPPSLSAETNLYQFQVPKEKPVRVELLEGYFDKDMNVFVAKKTHGVLGFEAIEEEPPEKPDREIWFGFYDGYRAPIEHVNLYKTYLGDPNIENVIDQGKKLCLMISGFQKDSNGYVSDYEIERRWKAQEPALKDKIRDAIKLVYVMDEPWHKGYDVDFQERAVDVGREIFGDFKYGFSHMGDHIMNPDKVIARNVDFVGYQAYCFYHPEWADEYNNDLYHVNSKEDFMAFQNKLADRARAKVPGKPLLLTMQGFYMDKQYREPYIKEDDTIIYAPELYAELFQNNDDVLGGLWYTWKGKKDKEIAVRDMPEFFGDIKGLTIS